jgi:hypothetical protein
VKSELTRGRALGNSGGVSEPPKPRPKLSQAARAAQDERERRRAEALRANLRRRKAQERGRDAPPEARPEQQREDGRAPD